MLDIEKVEYYKMSEMGLDTLVKEHFPKLAALKWSSLENESWSDDDVHTFIVVKADDAGLNEYSSVSEVLNALAFKEIIPTGTYTIFVF